MPSNLDTYLIWSDAHIPFEDKQAFDLVLKVGRDIRPHGQIIIGDFADMLGVSSFPKTPPQARWQLKDEIRAVNKRLDQVDALGGKVKHYFYGNHEVRGQKLAAAAAPALYSSLEPASLFGLKSRGWTVHKYQQHAKIGKVHFVHDIGYTGKYAAWSNANDFQASTVQGHTHAASVVYFGNVLGKTHVSATIGWLGDARFADYMPDAKQRRNWQHAFGLAYVERESGNTHVQVVPVIDGRCVVNGRLYQ